MSEEKGTILLVDDDPFVREMMAFILQDAGFHVEMAENGKEAMSLIQSGTDFNLVVSDMNMPEMGGVELAAQIRKDGKTIPFIMLTGDNDTSSISSEAKSCVSAFLVKDEGIQDSIVASVESVLKDVLKGAP